MLEITLELYAYALYTLLIGAASTCIFVIYSLRGNDLPVKSIKIFQIYFIIGIIGWTVLAIKDLTNSTIELPLAATFYIVASFILFIAVVECIKNTVLTAALAMAHLIAMLICWLAPDEKMLLLILSIYILLVYPVIFLVSVKRALKMDNTGNAIIAFAAFIVIAAAPLVIQRIVIYNDINFAYSTVMITSAVGFVMIGIGFLTSILINEHKLLTSLALNDPLTGLLNRRGLDFELRTVLAAAKRKQTSISIIAIDIDHFKKINDKYGHDGGDLVLQNIADTLSSCPRESDVCSRLGGEEFVIVLPETYIHDALNIAERIRQLIEKSVITTGEHTIRLTASFGVSSDNTGIDIDRLLKDADKALYKAKVEGRNCVRQAF